MTWKPLLRVTVDFSQRLLHDLLSFVARPYFPVVAAKHSQTVSEQLTSAPSSTTTASKPNKIRYNLKYTIPRCLFNAIYSSSVAALPALSLLLTGSKQQVAAKLWLRQFKSLQKCTTTASKPYIIHYNLEYTIPRCLFNAVYSFSVGALPTLSLLLTGSKQQVAARLWLRQFESLQNYTGVAAPLGRCK